MSETCLFDVMDLPKESLRRVLPKASTRVIARLLSAYPRSVGRTFLAVLSETMSPITLQFLKDEMFTSPLPSLPQIREAERELLKLIRDENVLPSPLAS